MEISITKFCSNQRTVTNRRLLNRWTVNGEDFALAFLKAELISVNRLSQDIVIRSKIFILEEGSETAWASIPK